MKDLIERITALILLLMLSPILLSIAFLIRITSSGPPLHWSRRSGVNGENFLMPKFRTMTLGTPDLASHLLKNPENHLISIGGFLRKYSLDELPQLISIAQGKMSFVGPRPALHNQHDLIRLRCKNSIDKIKPGVTGWAQINGRDEVSIQKKIELDKEYLAKRSIKFDLHIIIKTILQVLNKKDISH